MDYGHKQYLDKLVNDRGVVLAALHRLVRRTAEVRHKQKKWFAFVRERQEEEEAAQVKEAVKVKEEAQLYRRYMKQVGARTKVKQKREAKRRQDAFLDQAYEERLRQDDGVVSSGSEEDWDPIEDIIKGEKEDLIALMYRLLWIEMPQLTEEAVEVTTSPSPSAEKDNMAKENKAMTKGDMTPGGTPSTGTVALTRNAKKRAKAKAKAKVAPSTTKDDNRKNDDDNSVKIEVNETREDMRNRLLRGLRHAEHGMLMLRQIDDSEGQQVHIPGMPPPEVDKLLSEVAEIKALLLCRLLLSQSSLLPIALRANNVSDLFAHPELDLADLRDLCLRFEKPKLQEIRDACADFARGSDEYEDDSEQEDEQTAHELALKARHQKDSWRTVERERDHRIPDRYRTKHEKAIDAKAEQRRQLDREGFGDVVVDFGVIDDEDKFQNRKVRVRVCGKTIWNYPSEKSIARSGWLQFSVIAKGARFEDAVVLCRNWEEFWELSNLAIFNYFSATSWATWASDVTRKQQLQLGIFEYMAFPHAREMSTRRPTGRRAFGGRMQPATELKNIACFCIKRNDPVSRRFVQYLRMQNRYVCMMVRDAKTGKVLIEPPQEHTWLVRHQGGLGDDDWVVRVRVGDEQLFSFLEGVRSKSWQFGFNDYYDVTVWDLLPGERHTLIYSIVQDAMIKAPRMYTHIDFWAPVKPIMETLHHEVGAKQDEVGRVRDARPGESTIYHDMTGEGTSFSYGQVDPSTGEFGKRTDKPPANYFYNDVDAAEDLVLFPEEIEGTTQSAITGTEDPMIPDLPNMKRFVLDLDSDQESDDHDDPFESRNGRLAISGTGRNETQQITNDEDWETEESDDEWPPDDLPECPDPDDPNCTCPECKWWDEHDRVIIPTLEDSVKRDGHAPILPLDVQTLISNSREAARLNAYIFDPSDDYDRGDIEAQFMTFMDRDKAKTFKKMWHEAEFESEVKARWLEHQHAIKEARAFVVRDIVSVVQSFHILMWLGVHQFEHKRVVEDMFDAMAATALYFVKPNANGIKSMLADWSNRTDKPIITDNESKVRLLEPYARTPRSNRTQPDSFWTDVDRVWKSKEREIPHDWDLHCRPRVAMLAKAGVIGPGFCPYPEGDAAFAGEEGQAPHLVIDYRSVKDDWPTRPKTMADPAPVKLLHLAQSFAKDKKSARFSLLRIWSHPLFYPFMLGIDNRDMTSFNDTVGRAWEFKFVPKDMPGSEISAHKNVSDRVFGVPPPQLRLKERGNLYDLMKQNKQGLPRFEKHFRGKVEVKRDMVLVMGDDEKDFERLVTAVVFAIQTKPWRLEVDLWKSFVNVDLSFLEVLDAKWLE